MAGPRAGRGEAVALSAAGDERKAAQQPRQKYFLTYKHKSEYDKVRKNELKVAYRNKNFCYSGCRLSLFKQ